MRVSLRNYTQIITYKKFENKEGLFSTKCVRLTLIATFETLTMRYLNLVFNMFLIIGPF